MPVRITIEAERQKIVLVKEEGAGFDAFWDSLRRALEKESGQEPELPKCRLRIECERFDGFWFGTELSG